jgi:RNA ligase
MNQAMLYNLLDKDLYYEMLKSKYIKEQTHPNFPQLTIVNYTDACMWDQEWNEVTVTCRGLIFNNESKTIVARSFNKFFNSDQEQAPKWSLDTKVQVTDKVDGSLGILYKNPDGDYAICTRGSFTSDQSVWATKHYNNFYKDLWQPVPGITYLFEIIYPENRIVLDYEGLQDLILIGVVETHTGKTFSVLDSHHAWPGPLVKTELDYASLEEVLLLPQRDNAEGFVLWNMDTDERVKIKYDHYKILHKLLTNTNAKHVWEVLSTGQDPDTIFSAAPDEFHEWAKLVVSELKAEFSRIKYEATKEYVDTLKTLAENFSRKDFAQVAAKSAHKSILFKIYDEQSYDSIIWGSIKPSGTITFRKIDSDAD